MISPEIVIYDDAQHRELGEEAHRIAESLGLVSFFTTDAEEASHRAGFFTRGIVTSDLAHSGHYAGLSPFAVSDMLEIPRFVFVENHGTPGSFVRNTQLDVAVRRSDDHIDKHLVNWFVNLPVPKL